MSDPLRALWGALVGDACGATLEFYPSEITESIAARAMTMPGGGSLCVGPGQITDDGELSLALWSVLKDRSPSNGFPSEDVARAYVAWYESGPFDRGYTCSNAFDILQDCFEGGDLEIALATIDITARHSEANGAMMRATPIAVWHACSALNHEEAAVAASIAAAADARLSHPNQATQDANAVYVYALTLLLTGLSPSRTAERVDIFSKNVCDTVQQWVEESKRDWEKLSDARHNIGHVRHAFTLALWFLRHSEVEYGEALLHVLLMGGDTDTNAAIVGGLVACYHPIPEMMLGPVQQFDAVHGPRKRPAAYGVRYQLP